jgi:glycosyltransferase involved in cell wall biosynthesis
MAMSLLSLRPGRVGGAETYVRKLVEFLPQVSAGEELVLVADRDVAAEFEAPGWRRAVVPFSARRVVAQRVLEAYTPWRATGLERLLAHLRADVLFFPQQSIFPARVSTPAVLTVGDVQHLAFPQNFGLFDRTFRPRVYPRSMETARHLIAISEFTRRTLLDTCGIDPGKVTTIPLGFTPREISGAVPSASGAPYLYYPAATYPHKDHATLFRTLAALRRRGELRHRLVLTGLRTREWKGLRRLLGELGLEEVVEHRGYVSRAEVDALYAGAASVVFPSRYEGFGMPVVEASGLGRCVVTSRLPVFDEIGVPKRFQIDFADPEALLAALQEPGPTVLERRPSTWREVAERTLEVLRRAARGGDDAPHCVA